MYIREAKVTDAAAICRISSKDLGYECEEKFVKERLEHLDTSREVVFVAELNDAVAGYVHAEIYNLLYFESMVNILGLAVSSDCRRQGAGNALMKQVEEWAKEKGIKEIRLNSGGTRKEAHDFYRAIGFDDEKVQIRFFKRGKRMKELIIKKEKNNAATKEEFIADLDILFDELKNSYGGYEYFGEERFRLAKKNVLEQIQKEYTFENAISILREEFTSFIYDGHFSVDGVPLHHRDRKQPRAYDYAVKIQEVEGIPVFDIKKFYYDTEEEKLQLEVFAKSGADYKNCPYLIFDLRKNGGGSDMYLWEFIKDLTGEEPEPPMDFLQKNSDTFLAVLKEEYGEEDIEPGGETYKSEGKIIRTGQKIFVLIDRFVCSSGESAIANLKTIEGTVVVGENSGGCYFSGNCINIYLPNTGICVYYGTGRVLYNGTQNIDELGGFAPDIYGEFEVEDIVAMAKETMEK